MDVLIDRTDLRRGEVVDAPSPPLEPGQARLAVESFALTANNVTYAAMGDLMQYWAFFPAPEGWGRVPVWGFAEVVESTVDGVAVGDRVYGYLPMSHELVVQPERVGPDGFVDGIAHRAPMAAVYSRYQRVGAERDPGAEHLQSLLQPLFLTGFLLAESLTDTLSGPGQPVAVLSSASSKTAIGTAFGLRDRPVEVVGLTSDANRAFVEGLGCYDRVVTYAAVATELAPLAAAGGPVVFVDLAGNPEVTAAVHAAVGDALVASVIVGDTHWDENGAPPATGPRPSLFFAPAEGEARTAAWGRDGFEQRTGEAWEAFRSWASGWLRIDERAGAEAALATFVELADGRADPAVGLVVTMRPA